MSFLKKENLFSKHFLVVTIQEIIKILKSKKIEVSVAYVFHN